MKVFLRIALGCALAGGLAAAGCIFGGGEPPPAEPVAAEAALPAVCPDCGAELPEGAEKCPMRNSPSPSR
jgi:hypothetical protein